MSRFKSLSSPQLSTFELLRRNWGSVMVPHHHSSGPSLIRSCGDVVVFMHPPFRWFIAWNKNRCDEQHVRRESVWASHSWKSFLQLEMENWRFREREKSNDSLNNINSWVECLRPQNEKWKISFRFRLLRQEDEKKCVCVCAAADLLILYNHLTWKPLKIYRFNYFPFCSAHQRIATCETTVNRFKPFNFHNS